MLDLRFDNRFVRALPADPSRENRPRQVSGAAYSFVDPTPVAAPETVAHSPEVAELLGLSPLTRNFLGVLADNRRVAKLPGIIRAFATIAAAQRGEVQAEVASAHPLSSDQIATLETKLRAREGRTVKLKSRVDPDLLGGLVVTIGSQRIDSSIRTRLNSLAQAMKSA